MTDLDRRIRTELTNIRNVIAAELGIVPADTTTPEVLR